MLTALSKITKKHYNILVSSLRKSGEELLQLRRDVYESLAYLYRSAIQPDPLESSPFANYCYKGELTDFTESYVDGVRTLTSTGTGKFTIDGKTLSSTFYNILLVNQSDKTQNGMYEIVTSADGVPWVIRRHSSYRTGAQYHPGMVIRVLSGEYYHSSCFRLSNSQYPVLDRDELLFEEVPPIGIGQMGLLSVFLSGTADKTVLKKAPPGLYNLFDVHILGLGAGTPSDLVQIYRVKNTDSTELKLFEIDISSITDNAIIRPSSVASSANTFGQASTWDFRYDLSIRKINGSGEDLPLVTADLLYYRVL